MSGERVVLCHSLACLLWMRCAGETQETIADRVLLVAPPCTDEIAAVVRFRPREIDAATLARAARTTLMICSDEDPYCPAGAEAAFPGVFEDVRRIPGGGHLNTDAGYGPWPFAEDWALGRS
jgi:predicted alpha/beta hydrolase family esterase